MNTAWKQSSVRGQADWLAFGKGNAKLGKEISTFSLPAGWTCPGASQCLARANRETGKIRDGADQSFRCFAATAESAYRNVRESRWSNFEKLKGKSREEMASLILESLPSDAQVVRIHVSGDFFSESYFLAWCDTARAKPDVKFYAYTKSVHFWREHQAQVPSNLILTGSEGGKFDAQLSGLKTAKVVFSEEQAAALGLQIDHDDSHAYGGIESFALLLHGTQAKGSQAAKSLSALRAQGIGGYSTKGKSK